MLDLLYPSIGCFECNDIINNNETNYNIYFEDKYYNYDINELDKYKIELLSLVDYIYDQYTKGQIINVNILTDLLQLTKNQSVIDNKMILCATCCPCYQCQVDKEINKVLTGDYYTPSKKQCLKSFAEMTATTYLINKLGIEYDPVVTCYDKLITTTKFLIGMEDTNGI